jgi:hypothetical protein
MSFSDTLARLTTRYSTEDMMPPHVVCNLFKGLLGEVTQTNSVLPVLWEAIAKLQLRIDALEADKKYREPRG